MSPQKKYDAKKLRFKERIQINNSRKSYNHSIQHCVFTSRDSEIVLAAEVAASLSLGVGVGRDEQRREGEEHEDDAAGERDAAYRDARCDQAAAEHRAASAQEVAGQAAHQHTPHALRIETRAAHAYKAWIKRTRVLLEADVQLLRTFGRVFPLLLRVMHCVGERVELGT